MNNISETNFFNNTTSQQIYEDKYKYNNETPVETIKRVAKFLSTSDAQCKEFEDMMVNKLAMPAGRMVANAGVGTNLTLNNCFTPYQIPNDMGEIYECVKIGALTHKAGGGTGYDFSLLSPKGTITHNNAVASGVVSFMNSFNAQTETVKSGNRRGANMGVLNIYHPDIMDFITAKSSDAKALEYFNISVMIDDEFMYAVQRDEEITLHYPVYNDKGKILKNECEWEYSKKIKACELWDLIIHEAYNTGEPGVLFYDNINKKNNTWYIENIVSTNPCGEYLSGTLYGEGLNPLEYGGSCNLGSILLHHFVSTPYIANPHTFVIDRIDWDKLAKTVKNMVDMLDNAIDCNKFPVDIYENYQKALRTIGLGVTGVADFLALLGLPYDSNAALTIMNDVMDFIAQEAYKESIELAKEKGSFPFYDSKFLESGFLMSHTSSSKWNSSSSEWRKIIKDIETYGIRNARLLSIAPTGTLSLVWGENCSSGIEPIFALTYDRVVKIGGQEEENKTTITLYDYAYAQFKEAPQNFDVKENEKYKRILTTALDIDVSAHIEMLSVIAQHIDMGVSKTINVPSDYSFDKTKDIYMKCWLKGIKGCTIFRPNTLRQGILSTHENSNDNKVQKKCDMERGDIISVSDDLIGYKRKIITGCGDFQEQLFFDEATGEPMENYVAMGDGGGCSRNLEAISRLISLCVRGGISIESVITQLLKVRPCNTYTARTLTHKDTSKGSSCPSALGFCIEELIAKINDRCFADFDIDDSDVNYVVKPKPQNEDVIEDELKCPQCGEILSHQGGCDICVSCGYSHCG